MKKILLFISIITVSFVSAQQSNSFNIQNYLQKRIELYRKPTKDDLFNTKSCYCYGGYKVYDIIVSQKGLEILKANAKRTIMSELTNDNKIYPLYRYNKINYGFSLKYHKIS
jgi:hypothetical protein